LMGIRDAPAATFIKFLHFISVFLFYLFESI
jgi:hypothetical protein